MHRIPDAVPLHYRLASPATPVGLRRRTTRTPTIPAGRAPAGTGNDMGGLHPLLAWLDREVSAGLGDRTLVVCNSAMGAAALRRGLTAHRGALLGIDFVTAAGLARRLLMIGGLPCPDDLPDPLEERAQLGRLIAAGGAVGRYARRFDAALDHLLRTVKEVQTLGPARNPAELSSTALEVVGLADAFTDALADRGGRTRWIAQATVAAAADRLRQLPDRILVAGEVDPERDIRLLLQVLKDRGVAVAEWSLPTTTTPATIEFFSAPHPPGELRLAARHCLAAARRGVAWHDMVVAAPRLNVYAPHLPHAFASEGVPFHTAIETPLLHHGRAAVCLHLARLLFDRAPRVSFMALLSSHLLRKPIPPEEQAHAEVSSRRRSLSGMGADTAQFVAELDADRRRPAPAAVRLLRTIVRRAGRAARSANHPARSKLLREAMAELLGPPAADDALEEAVTERLEDCLQALGFADADGAGGERYTAVLEDLLRERTVPLTGRTRGGVAVVSYREALAFPCRTLHLLGLSRDQVPGPVPLATFLGDGDREALDLISSEIARVMEEQRVCALLHHADQLTLSYARTDAGGSTQELTLWADRLRQEIDLPDELREPGHPETQAQRAVVSGCCPPDLARNHLALGGCREPAAFTRLVGADTTRILTRTERLESFSADRLERDGDIGSGHGGRLLRRAIAATEFERLGKCPQQFLFRQVMGIVALPEEPDPLSLPRDRMGTLIHDVVEHLYRDELGRLQEATEPVTLAEAMCEHASRLLANALERDTSILRREFPGLHDLLRRRWTAGLHHAIREDLALMQHDGSRPTAVELELQARLRVRRPGEEIGTELHVNGKLDRLDTLPEQRQRILDFKTGRKPQLPVDAKNIFKGTNLQLVLYAMLLRATRDQTPAELEVRSLRPRSDVDAETPFRLALPNATDYLIGRAAPGVQESLAILGRLLGRGLFLPVVDRHCGWCDYKAACRRYHPPSASRVEECNDAAATDFAALRGKSSQNQLLDPLPVDAAPT